MTTQEIIEVIKGLSVLELNDLVKACEEEFGVSAAAGIATIATIPSREELLSKLLGSMQSPITNFARVIKQIAEKNEEVA